MVCICVRVCVCAGDHHYCYVYVCDVMDSELYPTYLHLLHPSPPPLITSHAPYNQARPTDTHHHLSRPPPPIPIYHHCRYSSEPNHSDIQCFFRTTLYNQVTSATYMPSPPLSCPLPRVRVLRTQLGKRRYSVRGILLWNQLPPCLHASKPY